jgi:hypothetical protein
MILGLKTIVLVTRRTRGALALVVCLLGTPLAGCAGLSDSMLATAFVDPAKYDLYDCPQLRKAREDNAKHLEDLTALRAKAETGAGGAVISEVAYGNDFVAARAQSKLADEVWLRDRCDQEPLPPVKADPAAAEKGLSDSGARNRAGVR